MAGVKPRIYIVALPSFIDRNSYFHGLAELSRLGDLYIQSECTFQYSKKCNSLYYLNAGMNISHLDD